MAWKIVWAHEEANTVSSEMHYFSFCRAHEQILALGSILSNHRFWSFRRMVSNVRLKFAFSYGFGVLSYFLVLFVALWHFLFDIAEFSFATSARKTVFNFCVSFTNLTYLTFTNRELIWCLNIEFDQMVQHTRSILWRKILCSLSNFMTEL